MGLFATGIRAIAFQALDTFIQNRNHGGQFSFGLSVPLSERFDAFCQLFLALAQAFHPFIRLLDSAPSLDYFPGDFSGHRFRRVFWLTQTDDRAQNNFILISRPSGDPRRLLLQTVDSMSFVHDPGICSVNVPIYAVDFYPFCLA